ncbi:MAG: VIT domain-containing protein [Candidatus Sumerlaeia bacterium]
MRSSKSFSHVILVLIISIIPATGLGQGFMQLVQPGAANDNEAPDSRIIIDPPQPPRPPRPPIHRRDLLPAELASMELQVEIDDQVARTRIDQSFKNPNNRRLEGVYYFPLPADAAVSDLSLYIDGKPMKCEVLDAKKARDIYEGIVRQMRDPALLEYVGRDLVKLRIFPFEAQQVRRVRFEYSQVLKRDFGLTEFAFPLVARHEQDRAIGNIAISGTVHSDVPITTIYCPTHNVDFVRKDEKNVRFSYEAEKVIPEQNLKIYYAVSKKDMGAGLVTYRSGDDDGYFMLMLAPRSDYKADKIMPKDVVFVFDTSGSMNGDKIVQAREALKYCLNSLREEDRFNVVRFSTESEALFDDGQVLAKKDNVDKALEFVKGFEASGGTAIHEALLTAIPEDTDSDRPFLLVFLTDGKPTIGEKDIDKIVGDVSKENRDRLRIFTFGVGNSVNTRLLDTLAEKNGGVTEYVTPREDIEIKVSNFFMRVSDPVMTDVMIDYDDADVKQQYPRELHDLFAGSQVKIIGRYANPGKNTILLKGKINGDKKAFEYELDFPEKNDSADFLPRLWAIRRVGYLVDNIRQNGEEQELVDEIVHLGKKHAIATPYTSMLVVEDERIVSRPGRPGGPQVRSDGVPSDRMGGVNARGSIAQDSAGRAGSLPPSPMAMTQESGEEAVQLSTQMRRMRELQALPQLEKRDGQDRAGVKHAGGRTFYMQDGFLVDSEYPEDTETTEIEYGSDAYFDFLSDHPEAGVFLALGKQVVFQLDGKWYRIIDKNAE